MGHVAITGPRRPRFRVSRVSRAPVIRWATLGEQLAERARLETAIRENLRGLGYGG